MDSGPALLVRLHPLQTGGEGGPEVVGVVVGPFVSRNEADQGHDYGAQRQSFSRKRPRFGPYSRFLNVKPRAVSESRGDAGEVSASRSF